MNEYDGIDEKVLKFIRKHGGKAKSSEVAELLGCTTTKASRLLIRLCRWNLLEPSDAESHSRVWQLRKAKN